MIGKIVYKVDNIIRKSTLHTNQDIKIDLYFDHSHLKFNIQPKQPIELLEVSLEYPHELIYDLAYINGFQTWTDSGIFTSSGHIKRQNKLLDIITKPISDYIFYLYKNKRGICHSYTYLMLQNDQSNLLFISESDDVCYSIYEMDFNTGRLMIRLDVEGMYLTNETELLSMRIESGDFIALKEKYFKNRSQKVSGWTSWYNYYTDINEEILLNNLNHINEKKLPFEIFQIDDGYQTKVGDWLSVKETFPRGMAFLSEEIKLKGYTPGIWLAPFIVLDSSEIFKKHPDWLMEIDGVYVKAGWSPVWKGHYYTLDIYKDEVIAYLEEVFDIIINTWGFKFLKLDFLYAMATPYKGKSRSAVMTDGVKLIQSLTKGAEILGCGVPLINVKDRFKFCRIGADVYEKWEYMLLKHLKYRERVSTYNALKSTIGRSLLNGSWFTSDPDVFYLRNGDVKMTATQKNTLFKVNVLLGSLLFVSDDVGLYTKEMDYMLRSMYPLYETEIISIDVVDELYEIEFSSNNRVYILYINLSKKEKKIRIKSDLYLEGALYEPNHILNIKPFETRVGHLFELQQPLELLGCEGHILPLGNLQNFDMENSITNFSSGNPVEGLFIASKKKLNYDHVKNYKSYNIYRLRGPNE
ncbi:MAG: alpha-galactosidase [Clostridiales bacterium]|nr:alpha-galactosidase [Clostridiales bacterium]